MIINSIPNNDVRNEVQYIDPFKFTYKTREHTERIPQHNLDILLVRHFDTGYFSIYANSIETGYRNKYSLLIDDEQYLTQHTFNKEIIFHGNVIRKPIEKIKKISIVAYDSQGNAFKSAQIDVSFEEKNIENRIIIRGKTKMVRLPYAYYFGYKNGVPKITPASSYTFEIEPLKFNSETSTPNALKIVSYYYWNQFWDAKKFSYHIKVKGDELKILESSYTDVSSFRIQPIEHLNSVNTYEKLLLKTTLFQFLDSYKYDLNEQKIKLFDPIEGKKGILINPNFSGSLLFSQKIEIESFGKFEILWKQNFEKSQKYPNKNRHLVRIKTENLSVDSFYQNRYRIDSERWYRLIDDDKINNEYLENKFLYKKRDDDEE